MSLQISFAYKNLNAQERDAVRRYFGAKEKRIDKFVNPGEAAVFVRVERFAKKAAYKAEVIVKHRKHAWRASEDDHTIPEALDFAIDKLVRQMERARELSHAAHHKFPRRNSFKELWLKLEELVGREAETAGRERGAERSRDALMREREAFFRTVEPLVRPALALLRHELSFIEGEGNNIKGVEAEEVVDEAVLALWERRGEKPPALTLEQWFYRTALALLHERMSEKGVQETEMSLDERQPKVQEAYSASNLGDEIRDFWQPDEILTIADTLGYRDARGLTLTQKKQFRTMLRTLAHVSPQARQAFMLRFKEGFETAEVALIQRRQTRTVEKDIADTLARLKAQIV